MGNAPEQGEWRQLPQCEGWRKGPLSPPTSASGQPHSQLPCPGLSLCCTLIKAIGMSSSLQPCSPPGSSVHGLLQARILEWVAMPSSRGSNLCIYISCIGSAIWEDQLYYRLVIKCNFLLIMKNILYFMYRKVLTFPAW